MTSPEEHRAAVRRFYAEIWNKRNIAAVETLLADDLTFRCSLGVELDGRDGFRACVAEVTEALEQFRCDIDTLVADGQGAAARMRFSGRHPGVFMGAPSDGPARPSSALATPDRAGLGTPRPRRLRDQLVFSRGGGQGA